jgi:hypothetical protein
LIVFVFLGNVLVVVVVVERTYARCVRSGGWSKVDMKK